MDPEIILVALDTITVWFSSASSCLKASELCAQQQLSIHKLHDIGAKKQAENTIDSIHPGIYLFQKLPSLKVLPYQP